MRNNIITIILAFFGAFTMVSCQEDLQQDENYTGKRISVTAHTKENTSTRTTLSGFETQWVAGDQIGTFSPQAESFNDLHTAAVSGTTSAFTGDMVWGSGTHDFYAYYPHTAGTFACTAVPISMPALQTQAAGDNSDHLADLDFMIAEPLSGITPGGEVSFRFSHLFTLLEFRIVGAGEISKIELSAEESIRLAFSDGIIDISQNKPSEGMPYAISYSGAVDSVAVEITSPASLTDNDETTPALYMMINPVDLTGQQFSVRMTIEGTPKKITADGFRFHRGRKYVLVIDSNKAITDIDLDFDVLTMIPDPQFLAYCQNAMRNTTLDAIENKRHPAWDTNCDGKLSLDEAAAVTCIYCPGCKIASLEGIEYFIGLTHLYCHYNSLTTLDLSNNRALTRLYCQCNYYNTLYTLATLDVSKNAALKELYCYDNLLTSFYLPENSALEVLHCGGNQFVTLDVSNHNMLTELWCSDNVRLSTLKVSNNNKLIELWCTGNYQLATLDASNNTSLIRLKGGGYNYQLTTLDVSGNTALEELYCTGNLLTTLNLSDNTALKYLHCSEGQLTSLDLSKNTALTELYCSSNQLSSLDVSKNTSLTILQCSVNLLTSLDVSKNTSLTQLICGANNLTSLYLSKNNTLTDLWCGANQLTTLDASDNTALEYLNCSHNQLTSLNVSNNTALKTLDCIWNQIISLDLSDNTALEYLDCSHNRLISLDISNNRALTNLNCGANPGYDSTFLIKAWFTNLSIPPGFSGWGWWYNGSFVDVVFYTGETPP